jgi:hypothetical protein
VKEEARREEAGIVYLAPVMASEPGGEQRGFHFENGYKRKCVYLTFVTRI